MDKSTTNALALHILCIGLSHTNGYQGNGSHFDEQKFARKLKNLSEELETALGNDFDVDLFTRLTSGK